MIQQILANIISQLAIEGSSPSAAPTFIHGWKGYQNIASDEVLGTIAYLYEPVTSNDIVVGSYLQETYPVLMGFFEKSEVEWTPEQHLEVVDRMRRIRAKFIYLCKQSPLFRYVESPITSDEFNIYDVNLSGVGLQIKLTPLAGIPVC